MENVPRLIAPTSSVKTGENQKRFFHRKQQRPQVGAYNVTEMTKAIF